MKENAGATRHPTAQGFSVNAMLHQSSRLRVLAGVSCQNGPTYKSDQGVSEWMSLKRETPEPIEERDARNVKDPHSRSAMLRKTRLRDFPRCFVGSDSNYALLLPIHVHGKYRSVLVLVGEAFICIWVVFAVLQILRTALASYKRDLTVGVDREQVIAYLA